MKNYAKLKSQAKWSGATGPIVKKSVIFSKNIQQLPKPSDGARSID
jgi:hypothetical protein